jgi:molybdenum cofactor cytidylyltransferase
MQADLHDQASTTAAIVLAAGQSRRMGQPKLVLPWGNTTIIRRVVQVLQQAGISETVVVTGSQPDLIEAALQDCPVRCVYNPDYLIDLMLISLQTGLNALPESAESALIVLGDQPQIEPEIVRAILECFYHFHERLIIPSYQNHRGHPWLLPRSFWLDLLAWHPPQTLRDFIVDHSSQIHYLPVSSSSVVADIDTPADYAHDRPSASPENAV